MSVNRRKRRTAAEAREQVLQVAASRLQRYGLEGLNIVGVAEEVGISHATLIHHFGSSEGMRQALVERMTALLVQDAVETLSGNESLDGLFEKLFSVFSTGGHAKLLAWLAIEHGNREPPSEAMRGLFDALVLACTEQLPGQDMELARHIITLVISAAIGLGVAGDQLAELVGTDAAGGGGFPRWLAGRVGEWGSAGGDN